VGDHVFRIIYTPGHASDGIVLYHKRDKLLISSDTLWENDLAVMTLRVEGSAAVFQMLASLERIATLDVRRVYPGHGRPFNDFSGAIARSRRRLKGYMADRQRIGNDLLKKLIVYTLLMKKTVAADSFFALLMDSIWYRETVDLYFNGAYRSTFDDILEALIRRKAVRQNNNTYLTTVPP
jgi:glyoxylase-like metal-dependent hydrolase (beta-lactamase superfamily II)